MGLTQNEGMGADAFVAFYGIKISLDPDDEDTCDAYGMETHPDCVAATAAGLDTHTGRMTDGEDYFVYIGRRLGWLGIEHDGHVVVDDLVDVAERVGPALLALGHRGVPALHLQLEAQY